MEGWTTIFVRSMACPGDCVAGCGANRWSGSAPEDEKSGANIGDLRIKSCIRVDRFGTAGAILSVVCDTKNHLVFGSRSHEYWCSLTNIHIIFKNQIKRIGINQNHVFLHAELLFDHEIDNSFSIYQNHRHRALLYRNCLRSWCKL